MASQFATFPLRVSSTHTSDTIDVASIKALIGSYDRDPSSAPTVSRQVQKALIAEMEGLTKSMGSRITKIEASLDSLDQQIAKGAGQSQRTSSELTNVQPEQSGFVAQLIALGKEVDYLRRSVVLNSLVVIDLARRHDKALPLSITEHVLTALGRQCWYSSPRLAALASRARSLGRTILTMPGSSHTKAFCSSEKCGICLGSLNSAITLPCSHRFCWNCLSSARAHQHTTCPLCRAEMSLDPREYVLDPVLFDSFAACLGPALASDLLRIPPASPKGVCRSAKTHSLDGIDMIAPTSPNAWRRGAAASAIGVAPALATVSPAPSPSLNPNAPEFSPLISFSLPQVHTPNTRSTKSPFSRSAAPFVPGGAFDLGAPAPKTRSGSESRQMSEGALPFRTPSATATLLNSVEKPVPPKPNTNGLIRYSIQTLLAMRPLNPLAEEFIPSSSYSQEQESHSEEEEGFSVWVNKRSAKHRKAQPEPSKDRTKVEQRKAKDTRCGFVDSASRFSGAEKPRAGAVKL